MPVRASGTEPLTRVLGALSKGQSPSILVTRFDPAAGEDLVGRDFLVSELRRVILDEVPAVFAETVFNAASVELVEVLDAAREVSLMAPKRLVLVRGSRLAGGGADTEEEEIAEAAAGRTGGTQASADGRRASETMDPDADARRISVLDRYRSGASASACIAFIGCPWDGRRRIHKAVLAVATVVDVSRPDPRETPGWIEAFVRRAGARIEPSAASDLAELRGNDTMRIASEIEKLLLHAGDTRLITKSDVAALVGAGESTSAWALGEALAEGDAAHALLTLRRLLAEGHAAPMVVGAIAARLRQLVVLRDERIVGSVNEAARKIVFPGRSIYFADGLALKAARYPDRALTDSLRSLYEVDKRSKSTGIDAGILLEEWLVSALKSFQSVRS